MLSPGQGAAETYSPTAAAITCTTSGAVQIPAGGKRSSQEPPLDC